MKQASLNSLIHTIKNQYQKLEDFFTKGSFGVIFYPILMHPCVRHSHSFVVKIFAVLSVFIGLYFLFAELITILFSDASLSAYLHHTIFELAQPQGTLIDEKVVFNSPLSFVIRASFLTQGYLFAVIYWFAVMRITHGIRLITGLLAILISCGMILISSAQGGKWTVGGLQNLGASLTFLLGNLMLIITAFTIKASDLSLFRQFSVIAGSLGLAAILVSLFQPTEYLPLLERISLYSLLIWEIAAGFAILKQVK